MTKKLQSLHALTGLQESLFAFEASLEPQDGQTAYIEQFTCNLVGNVDVLMLSNAWRELSDRHVALRTAFVRNREGKAMQAVLVARAPKIETMSLEGAETVASLAREQRLVRFDLARDPLLRVVLIPSQDGSCRMIVTFHHIILDAWSAPTLIDDLMALYARGLGRGPALDAPARATNGILADSQTARRGAACKAYWHSILSGAEMVALPILDGARAPGAKSAIFKPLPEELNAEMVRFAARHSVTSSAVLHAIWGVLLARLGDADSAVFGAVSANRGHDLPDIDRSVGLYAATLPVRVNLSGDENFIQICQDVQAQLRDGQLWSALPLADILAAGGLRADGMDHTMIGRPSSLAWGQAESLNFPDLGLKLCDYEVESWDHYDFQIGYSMGERPYLEARHDVNRVPAEQVEMVLSLLLDMLGRLMSCPSMAVLGLPICTSDNLASRIYGKTGAPAPLLADVIRSQDPATIALGAGTATLDRAALVLEVHHVAAAMADAGVGQGHRVAIAAPQSPAFVIQALACWQVGAAFVPINPAWPAARQQQVLDAARPKLILGLPERHLTQDPEVDLSQEGEAALAYCIFTSGSTGTPKGVAVPHDALANYCQSASQTFSFTAQDRALQITSPAFDLGYTTAFGVLSAGGSVFWLGAEAAVDPDFILQTMADQKISVIKATPAFLQLLLSAPRQDRFAALSQWRLLILGGESPNFEQISQLAELCPWLELAFHYGPAETTIGCSMTQPRPIHQWAPGDLSSLGTPVTGTEIRIVDRKGHPLPIGLCGEIAVGGAAVARGYLSPAPEDGFTLIDGQRFYRTGDLGKVTPEGGLVFIGRRDGIHKIRGHRVDPQETRLALLRDPLIEEAAVAIRGQGADAQVIAFIKIGDGAPDPARLREMLSRDLPAAQIPQRFVFLSRLLMTENGKTDTSAMLAALEDMPAVSGSGGPPRTQTEKQVARIWSAILGLEGIACDDDFFLLGGHSLRAIEISALLEREMGLRVPLRWFNDAPVLHDFASKIDVARIGDVAEGAQNPSPIMRLWGQDEVAQMLCFPGMMGNSSIYSEFLYAQALDFSVDGVDDLPPLDRATDVPSMVRWILEQAPDGGRGYQVLLGWSFGADLAFEAARQLSARGALPLVILLDRLPGEDLSAQGDSEIQLDTRRYWSQVMTVLRGSLPESRVGEYEAQFAQRRAKQRAYTPAGPLENDVVYVLAAPDGAVAQTRRDRMSGVSKTPPDVLSCGANHFSLFHPPYLAQWAAPLRSLIASRLVDRPAPKVDIHIRPDALKRPVSNRSDFSEKEVRS
ncbi:MAG: AMP-binding protein [Sulfitobacter sp.]